MRIGELADIAGVTPDTIRFYERRGVLPQPERRPSGYRDYSDRAVDQLRLAKALQAHGFTLDEIIDAMEALDEDTTCADERWRLEHVLARVDRRLAELQSLRTTVVGALAACDSGSCQLNPSASTKTSA